MLDKQHGQQGVLDLDIFRWEDIPEGLRLEIASELSDARYVNRKHPARATYALGCHGPLCRKSERDRQQSKRNQQAKAEGRELRPKKRDPKLEEEDYYLEMFTQYFFREAV